MTLTPFPLGRVVEHDEASKQPRFLAAMAPTITTATHKLVGGVLNQKRLGSCTGNACAHSLNTVSLRPKGRPLLKEADAIQLYSMATARDNVPGSYPPNDTGSSGLAVCKAAKERGYIGSYHHAFGLDQALAAVSLSPVLIGVNWYEDMFSPNSSGFVTPGGTLAGGHEVCVIGVNAEQKYIELVNSWGAKWGVKGHFFMTWDVFGRLLKEQGDVTVPVL